MLKVVFAIGAIIAVVAGIVFLMDSTLPRSTQGVHVIGDNKVRLPAGETFVLTHQVGKVTETWKITFNGDDSVRFNCDSWCGDLDTAKLHGVNNIVDIGAGWGDHFYVWLRPDGAVNIKWPWGWNYRGYKA